MKVLCWDFSIQNLCDVILVTSNCIHTGGVDPRYRYNNIPPARLEKWVDHKANPKKNQSCTSPKARMKGNSLKSLGTWRSFFFVGKLEDDWGELGVFWRAGTMRWTMVDWHQVNPRTKRYDIFFGWTQFCWIRRLNGFDTDIFPTWWHDEPPSKLLTFHDSMTDYHTLPSSKMHNSGAISEGTINNSTNQLPFDQVSKEKKILDSSKPISGSLLNTQYNG